MKTYTLKEVSKILNIPKSTLRYWEKEGLIRSERNLKNEYREYTTEELMIIGDIAFYRSLHLPIKSLKNLKEQTIEDKHMFMEASYRTIEQEIKELKKTQHKIEMRMNAVHLLDALKHQKFPMSSPDFPYIYHLHMENPNTVTSYLENQNLLTIVFDEQHPFIERYGILAHHEKQQHAQLWKANTSVTYVPCFIRVEEQHVRMTDLQPILDKIHSEKKRVGFVIGRYLVTDKNIDYFQGWIEVFET